MRVEGTGKLSLFQQFICSLMKLQLNSPGPFLTSLFDVSAASVLRLFIKWLAQMDIRLQDLIIWPDRESLQKTMPECFQESFGKKVAIIIDCLLNVPVICKPEHPPGLITNTKTQQKFFAPRSCGICVKSMGRTS